MYLVRPMYSKIKTNHHKINNTIIFYNEVVFVFKILSEAKNEVVS